VEVLENRLTVGPSGRLHAGVKAREVVVLGSIQGDVEATDKIQIRKDAKLVGNIKAVRIIVEDGAYLKGAIDVVKRGSSMNPLEGQHSASDLDRLAQATSDLEPNKIEL
jgi:cytoskeletal protein CcmA (bactofilin family)